MEADLTKVICDLNARMRLVRLRQEDEGDGMNLSERDAFILGLLSENGKMSVSEISAEDPQASDSTISTAISALWRKKMVNKMIYPENQRVTMVELTEKGRKAIDIFNELKSKRIQVFLEAINVTDGEKENLINVFSRAIKFLDEHLIIKKEEKS